jgi:signal transduction histidine kinase
MQALQIRGPLYTLLLVGALGLLLVILAILQYSWIGKMSEDERQMEAASLRTRVRGFQEELNFQVERACSRFEIRADDFGNEALAEFVARYERWRGDALYPGLVKALYLARAGGEGELSLLRLNQADRRMEPVDWPAALASLRARFGPGGMLFTGKMERVLGRLVEHGYVAEEIPAVVRLILPRKQPEGENLKVRARSEQPIRLRMLEAGLIIVVLDMDYIIREVIPALAVNHSLNDYSLMTVFRDAPEEVRVTSGNDITLSRSSDEAVDLFDVGLDSAETGRGARWRMLITHRAGSLDAAVAQARRRSLAVSFGILSLLAVSVVIIIVNSRRAQQLAHEQMEFVAGVSHEFRTPLSVIHAISENLADGLISEKKEVEQCGLVIRNDVRRLAGMVEQVLELAGAFRGKTLYRPAAVDVSALIDQVLEGQPALAPEGDWRVDKDISPGLPAVTADPAALASALRNVLENAIKYGGASRWIRVSARRQPNGQSGRVQITVEDRGIGIPPADLDHIFEPFYRGSEVRDAQIHGNGLGLSLVKSIVEAHGGQVRVSSTRGKGSSFTLDLPVAAPSPDERGAHLHPKSLA